MRWQLQTSPEASADPYHAATSVAEASLCCEPQPALLCSRSLPETDYNEQNNECAQAWSAEPRHFIDERPSPGHTHKDFLI